ncbi:hypothetical protein GOP47_0012450 [Adiantum capillus-veneris]|uniref:Uncharacterized protein n=1 Tax=Adiantum capillus-veneris TaxID=13818 RepID=A0A9D4UR65_ADICA|nr:hypothetical protein GOP47_0012450 [Adiantum capillus-veneris]
MLSDERFLHKKMRGKISPESRCRTYVVLNLNCNDAKLFCSLLRCNKIDQDSLNNVMDSKLLLSLLMLDEKLTDENAEAALQKAIRSWLLQLPASMISILYDSLLEVMENASQVEQEHTAHEIRKDGILEIWQDLEQAKMLGKLPPLVPPKEFEVELVANRITPIIFEVVAPDFKWRPVCTKVVEVHSQPGPMLARYARTGAEELLMNIITNTFPATSAGKEPDSAHPVKNVVRVVLGGGDGTLHYILAGYVGLIYSGHLAGGITIAGASQSVDMLFYLVPLGESNTLATYIAQRDLWYDATIYRPLVDRLPLIPHIGLSKDSEGRTASTNDATRFSNSPTPSKLLTKQIENYMFEANCLLKLSIYNCEGWYNYGAQHFHCTIPFLLRAEMGIPAASVCGAEDKTILHQESIPRTSLAPLDEESLQSFMSSYSFQAEATFRPIDWTGKEGEQKIKACSFTAIQAISVPRSSEGRLGCDPCSHFLDICLMESGNAKRLKDMSDIINYVSVYRANWLIVQAEDTSKPFVILLDGELYGPFYRVSRATC